MATRRQRGVPHLTEIPVPRGETGAAKMGASDGVAREAAAMSAKMMPATTKMRAAEAVPAAMAVAAAVSMAATMAAAVPSAMAATPGEYIARQRQNESKNRNSQRAPEHGTLPAVTPRTTAR
jgi:hypothetical protein